MKIITVIGARPQFIKAAAVSRAIAEHNAVNNDPRLAIQEIIVHTGQHFDANMSDIFFNEMQIPHPHYQLDINSVGHGAMTGRMLEKIEGILLEEQPDWVLVYGDTNSTLAGALAAKKLHIKVAHVEAGLRSFNMRMPEEINRILTDRISDILFCPTDTAMANLDREGFGHLTSRIVKSGDVMQDAALYYRETAAERSTIVSRLGLEGKDFVLCTIHRAENTDDPQRLASIVAALNEIAEDMPVVLPLHPRTTQRIVEQRLMLGFEPIEPVGYFDMISLLSACRIVMTDSGGVQKEAYFFGHPCVTLRDETEWTELVQHGFNILAGSDRDRILSGFQRMLVQRPDFAIDLYGSGQASPAIVRELLVQNHSTAGGQRS